ncbi:MAG: hypothetical protein H7A39_00195 [Chlamydiales bacterium]|nr:hypothetical protein [Chlamydiales bacterium]
MTFLIAFGIILICVIGLSIGKLITGKNKLHCKRCGKPEEGCSTCGKKRS